MADRFKKKGPRARTFIRLWREYRELSQDQLAEAMSELSKTGITGASVSRTENGFSPYSQDFLEVAAAVLGCSTTDLISRDPREEPGTPIEQAIKLLQGARYQR